MLPRSAMKVGPHTADHSCPAQPAVSHTNGTLSAPYTLCRYSGMLAAHPTRMWNEAGVEGGAHEGAPVLRLAGAAAYG